MVEKIKKAIKTLSNYIKGKEEIIEVAFISLLSKGHLLIEDIPGLGKTTLALGLAKVTDLSFGRVQCTPDLMPSDITGVSIFNQKTKEFEFKKGAIFNNILLVDEINRAMPKTQSALLEAMEEKQITADGKTYKLPEPFFVIATQNPLEQIGTFSLPESQLDRFSAKTEMGYPDKESELKLICGKEVREEIEKLKPILSLKEIKEAINTVSSIYVSEKIGRYILEIAWKTRESDYFLYGLSVRGVLTLTKSAKANAFLNGRDYIIPEDVIKVAPFTIPHKLILSESHETLNKKEAVLSLIKEVKPPV